MIDRSDEIFDFSILNLEDVENAKKELANKFPFASRPFKIDRYNIFRCPFPLMASCSICHNFEHCPISHDDNLPF